MKYLLLLLLCAGVSSPAIKGQAVIHDFSATVKGVTILNSYCYFWFNSPAAGQVQIACYTNGTIQYNSVQSLTQGNDISGAFPIATIPQSTLFSWVFTYSPQAPVAPSTIPTTIYYELAGLGPNDTTPAQETGNF